METVESVDELDANIDVPEEEEEEEKDGFMDEFSDNDNFEPEDFNNKEDF